MRSKFFNVVLLVWAVLQGPTAFAIGKVGTASIGDDKEGFVSDVPSGFKNIASISSEGVRLNGNIVFKHVPGFGAPTFEKIDALPLRIDYPEFATLSRSELRGYFENSTARWSPVQTSDPCIEAHTAANERIRTTILTWGEGRGYVIISDVGINTDRAVDSLVATTRLDSGACRW